MLDSLEIFGYAGSMGKKVLMRLKVNFFGLGTNIAFG